MKRISAEINRQLSKVSPQIFLDSATKSKSKLRAERKHHSIFLTTAPMKATLEEVKKKERKQKPSSRSSKKI